MTEPVISVATAADRPVSVATFVAAFAADPAVRFMFPDDVDYAAAAADMAGRLFDARVATGSAWVAEGGAAIALWDPPSDVRHNPPAGDSRFARYQRTVHDARPAFPHWYLGVLAAHPAQRGRRLGRAVMAPGLARAAADGLPAYLETSTPRNVEIYRSVGFEVETHLMVDDLPVWVMARG